MFHVNIRSRLIQDYSLTPSLYNRPDPDLGPKRQGSEEHYRGSGEKTLSDFDIKKRVYIRRV